MATAQKIIVILVLLAGITAAQYFFNTRYGVTFDSPTAYAMPAPVIKISDLGMDSAAASLIWLNTIQYLGSSGVKQRSVLTNYINTVNDLDPRFSYPYAFATLVFPGLKMPQEAIKIGERGIRESDPDWRIPYYMAVTYHIYLNDRESAARYFGLAASTPGAPDIVKNVAANYGSRSDLREQTRQIWLAIYETSKDEVVKKQARNYIAHLDVLDVLERAAVMYKAKNGKYPADIRDMIAPGILKAIPPDPFDIQYYIDSEGRARPKN